MIKSFRDHFEGPAQHRKKEKPALSAGKNGKKELSDLTSNEANRFPYRRLLDAKLNQIFRLSFPFMLFPAL
jgi:hypothetical protein